MLLAHTQSLREDEDIGEVLEDMDATSWLMLFVFHPKTEEGAPRPMPTHFSSGTALDFDEIIQKPAISTIPSRP